LEAFVDFTAEFSVILCRAATGRTVLWPAPRNLHRDGILDQSVQPAGPEVAACVVEAEALARGVADALDYVGVLTLEFFATAEGPVFNEMAPRSTIAAIGRSKDRSARSSRTTSAPFAACRSAIRAWSCRACA
jgi:phosphoribosylaminoimidazole carboxylase (NCAIR synthetase)